MSETASEKPPGVWVLYLAYVVAAATVLFMIAFSIAHVYFYVPVPL